MTWTIFTIAILLSAVAGSILGWAIGFRHGKSNLDVRVLNLLATMRAFREHLSREVENPEEAIEAAQEHPPLRVSERVRILTEELGREPRAEVDEFPTQARIRITVAKRGL
jgi:hypothetical protein